MFKKLLILVSSCAIPFIAVHAQSSVTAPKSALYLNLSPGQDRDSSSILGAEFQWNARNYTNNTFWGFHGLVQRQKYGSLDTSRWGLGLSLNYQTDFSNKASVGLKQTVYGGMGRTQKALDCLACSNVDEKYSGGETFFTVSLATDANWVLKVEKRISDNRSKSSTNANDPWRVGASYSSSYKGVPDPALLISVGRSF